MKRKLINASLITALSILVAFIGFSTISAKDKVQNVQIKLDLNGHWTEKSNQNKMNKTGLEKNFQITPSNIPNSFINVNLNFVQISENYSTVSGNGVIHIGQKSYPFEIAKQPYPIYYLSDNTYIYSGGLIGSIRSNFGENDFILGMDYNPSSNSAFISSFAGYLDEEIGLGILRFGEPILTKEIVEVIEATKNAGAIE